MGNGPRLIAHAGSVKRLKLVVPGAVSALAHEQGDDGRVVSADNGGTTIEWTLGDAAKPYRYLNVTPQNGKPYAITALNLHGLNLCVHDEGGADVADLVFPNNLGTARFRVQGSAVTVEAGSPNDVLSIVGMLTDGVSNKETLSGNLKLSLRQMGTEVASGIASLGANALDGSISAAQPLQVSIADAAVSLYGMTVHLTKPKATVTASLSFVLPASLQFELERTDVALTSNGAGAIGITCDKIEIKPKVWMVGASPRLTVALADPGVTVRCNPEGRFTIDGTLAIGWPHLGGEGITTRAAFSVASDGALKLTAQEDSPRQLQFSALGLDVVVVSPTVSATRSELALDGDVTLGFSSFTTIASQPTKLRLAIRPATNDGAPELVPSCGDATSGAKTANPVAIILSTSCAAARHEVFPLTSSGGALSLPPSFGGGVVTLPQFMFADGKISMSGKGECSPSKGASSGAFMSFGPISVTRCEVGYDQTTESLNVAIDGSLSLPDYLAAGVTNVAVSAVYSRPKVRLPYTVSIKSADLQARQGSSIKLLGMNVSPIRSKRKNSRCTSGSPLEVAPPLVKVDVDDAQSLTFTVCATADLPGYLSVENKARIGLLQDGIVEHQAPTEPLLSFDGLQFTSKGLVDPGSSDLSSTGVCDPPSPAEKDEPPSMTTTTNVPTYDCRAWGQYAKEVLLGPLAMKNLHLNLVASNWNKTGEVKRVEKSAPEFRLESDLSFAKYINGDGAGHLTAEFDHHQMLLLAEFNKAQVMQIGPVSIGLQSFQMKLTPTERQFIADAVTVSGENGLNASLYFRQVSFIETNEGKGWHPKKLQAPVDYPKTLLGLAYRLITDVGSAGFLNIFKLSR